ncbi:MAG: RNA pseudouridine synthase [Planctomycetota bacterium]
MQMLDPQSVLYEDNHLLVVDKPAGIVTQGAKPDEASMAKLAASYLKRKYSKPGNVFVGVVSRLDSRVSGVLILARTSKAASRISDQIRRQQMQKRYLACVEGELDGFSEATEVVHWMKKNDSMHRMEVVNAPIESKRPKTNKQPASAGKTSAYPIQQARLELRVIGRAANCTLVEVNLITGRKHQIRVQLAELGFPILCDTKYGAHFSAKGRPRSKSEQSGIALHCVRQQVKHPTRDEVLEFCSAPNQHWGFVPQPVLELVP